MRPSLPSSPFKADPTPVLGGVTSAKLVGRAPWVTWRTTAEFPEGLSRAKLGQALESDVLVADRTPREP